MRDVYILGIGMTRFAKHLDRSVKDLAKESFDKSIVDAGIEKDQIQAAWFSNSSQGIFTGQHCIRGQVCFRPLGISGIPIINVENACASGSTALHSAWLSVASGQHECALALGAEKMHNEDKSKTMNAFFAGFDVERIPEHLELLGTLGKSVKDPDLGDSGEAGKDRSPFMDVYSAICRDHMEKFGTTQVQLAAVAEKSHFHSSMNPNAQYQMVLSIDDILNDKKVSYPLTRAMCAPIGDGSAAAIVCSEEFMKSVSHPAPVRVLASVLQSGIDRKSEEFEKDIAARAGRLAFEMAGVSPEDIDLAEVHDASSFAEIHMTEALGFCRLGEGGDFALSGATRIGGKLPINTSGGLISQGHPIGATGLGQIHELVMQLRGRADKRQVENASVALAENGGGNIGFEEAAMCVHILQKV